MASTELTLSDQSIAPPSDDYCRSQLDPWLIRSIYRDSAEGRNLLREEYKSLRRKVLKKTVKSALKIGKPVGSYRTREHVRKSYERIWREFDWPDANLPGDAQRPTYATWKDETLVLKKGGLNQMVLDRIFAAISAINPASALEVGFGSGINVLALSVMFPEIKFAGIELSAEGFVTAKSVQDEDDLPDVIAAYCPREVKDGAAHKGIEFQQGDAANLPFDDNQFDVIFTRLALEQMELIRDDVLKGIQRVAKRAVILVEPFADYNQSDHLRLAKKAKNHFSLSVGELANYGLRPRARFASWPQKVSEGIGIVVATPEQTLPPLDRSATGGLSGRPLQLLL